MMRFYFAMLLLGLPLIGCAAPSPEPKASEPTAQAVPVEPLVVTAADKFAPQAVAATESRRRFISRELERSRGELIWPGHYYAGDGLGVNKHLSLAPISGFAFTWHGNMGLYDHNHGDLRVVGERIFLMARLPDTHRGLGGLPRELYPVVWGPRVYLVAAQELGDFVNAVNLGREPRGQLHGLFFLRGDDYTRPATGRPRLPQPFAARLLNQPLVGRITRVYPVTADVIGHDVPRSVVVELDLGQRDGVWRGMELCVEQPDVVQTITVTKVSDTTCEGVMALGASPPQAGWAVSSRFTFARNAAASDR